MKYQALRPQFFSVGGWGGVVWCGVVVGGVGGGVWGGRWGGVVGCWGVWVAVVGWVVG